MASHLKSFKVNYLINNGKKPRRCKDCNRILKGRMDSKRCSRCSNIRHDKRKFKDFIQSQESGRFIVNPYWLEYLLDLTYQGYLCEMYEEIIDTKYNFNEMINRMVYPKISWEEL